MAVAAGCAAPHFPPPPGDWIDDEEDLLDAPARARALEVIDRTEKAVGVELAVLTVHSTGSFDLDDYAAAVFNDWGIGKKGADNGVLLLVVTGSHDVKIEVGYGLESKLTDAKAGEILDEYVVPRFREEYTPDDMVNHRGMGRGIVAGLEAIAEAVGVPGMISADDFAPPDLLGLAGGEDDVDAAAAAAAAAARRGLALPDLDGMMDLHGAAGSDAPPPIIERRLYRVPDDAVRDPENVLDAAEAAAVRRVARLVAAAGGPRLVVALVDAGTESEARRRVRAEADDLAAAAAAGSATVAVVAAVPAGVVDARAVGADAAKAAAAKKALERRLAGKGHALGATVVRALPDVARVLLPPAKPSAAPLPLDAAATVGGRGPEAGDGGGGADGGDGVGAGAAPASTPAPPSGRCADPEGLLGPERVAAIDAQLDKAVAAVGVKMAALVVSSLGAGEGGDFAAYAGRVLRAWAGVDALLLVAADENVAGIAIAPGAEKRLTPFVAAALLDVVFVRHVGGPGGVGEAVVQLAQHLVDGIVAPGDTCADFVPPALGTGVAAPGSGAAGGVGAASTDPAAPGAVEAGLAAVPHHTRPSGASLMLRWLLGWVNLALWLVLFIALVLAVPAAARVPGRFHVVTWGAAVAASVALLVLTRFDGAGPAVSGVGFVATGWLLWDGWRRRCLSCGHWCQEWSKTLVPASYASAGTREVTRRCTACGAETKEVRTIPRRTMTTSSGWSSSSSSSSSSSWSSGSSSHSFGGGSSGGGGASRHW
jgi:uncharacterized membrane protein YgcG